MENGDTVWRPSPLLSAAIHGKIAVMDGLHRLNSGTLFTIRRFAIYFFIASFSKHIFQSVFF